MDASKAFEQAVASLLIAAGYEVRPESIIGFKKVDLYFEERRLGSIRRVAVECKHYKGVLSQSELTAIYTNYHPLYERYLIDEILVITQEGLAPSAQTMVQQTRALSHLTFAELQNLIMDFHPYLMGLISNYSEDGLSSYYVPIQTSDGKDLETYVENWLSIPSHEPLAILASYGMGKTTFARHLSYVLAQRALKTSNQRIPIFLRLGEISSEQSLEGLLGKSFTALSVVRNYTFDVFMNLNRAGRFIILLDGFDEMKHTLSWGEFKFNFREINRLVKGDSRVILLGRPTAFLSDQEHNFALHGIQSFQEHELQDLDWPNYQEIYLSSFSREQVEQFLNGYLNYKIATTKSDKIRKKIEKVAQNKIDRIVHQSLSDIASRPVQLKMLAEILPQWDGDISELTVAILYSIFIDLVIEREQDKIARKRFNIKDRRLFAKQIAWWLWKTRKQMNVSAEDIPESIIQQFCEAGENLEAVRRDLVSACFLERKVGEALYFPHRSFQEFLIAESIIDQLISEQITLREASAILTEEIATFMAGLVNVAHFKRWESALDSYRGTLSKRFAQVWISDPQYNHYLLERFQQTTTPWYPLFLTIGVCKGIYHDSFIRQVKDILIQKISNSADLEYAFLCYLCVIGLSDKLRGSWPRAVAIGSALAKLCNLREYTQRADNIVPQRNTSGRIKKQRKIRELILIPAIVRFMSRIKITKQTNPKEWVVDLSGTYPLLYKTLESYCLLSDWISIETLKTDDISLPTKINTEGFHDFIIVDEFIDSTHSQV